MGQQMEVFAIKVDDMSLVPRDPLARRAFYVHMHTCIRLLQALIGLISSNAVWGKNSLQHFVLYTSWKHLPQTWSMKQLLEEYVSGYTMNRGFCLSFRGLWFWMYAQPTRRRKLALLLWEKCDILTLEVWKGMENSVLFWLTFDWPAYSHSSSNMNALTSFPVSVCGLESWSVSDPVTKTRAVADSKSRKTMQFICEDCICNRGKESPSSLCHIEDELKGWPPQRKNVVR